MKFNRNSIPLLLLLISFFQPVFGQVGKGDLVDGIAAVVGNEIILESELQEMQEMESRQGGSTADRCEFLMRTINNKILVHKGKTDTLIENRTSYLKENANLKYKQILSQFPDEKTMLNTYKFRTGYEMKNAIERAETDRYYGQAKFARITDKVDVTPNEVTDFFKEYQWQLPEVKDEVTVAQIITYPKLTEAHRQEMINKLLKIKRDILAGESFDSQARIYSDDPGSASKGGLYVNIAKGQMVKPFEAAALNLEPGEISDPVESDFGFHLIQLVKKSGNQYDAKHILLATKFTDEEIENAKHELDSIRTQIQNGKMTFREAALKYSEDKLTKFNGGVIINPENQSTKIEKAALPTEIGTQLLGLKNGELSSVFEADVNGRKTVNLIKLEEEIPSHSVTIETDYDRIKEYALMKKKNELVEKWVLKEAPGTFISINKRYDDCKILQKLRGTTSK